MGLNDLDLTKYIILLAAESEVAFFLSITEREDTRTRSERKDPYGMSGHVVEDNTGWSWIVFE